MTQETGAHARQRMPERSLFSMAALACAVSAVLALPPSAQPRAEDKKETPLEDPLRGPMAAIAQTFRTGSSQALTSLLPPEGKVFLALDSVGGGASGYFGRDQVYFIFQQILSQNKTVRFDIRPRGTSSPEKYKDRERLVYCIGRWSFRGRDGNTGACQIHFALSMRDKSWTLVEIREAR